MVVKTPEKLDQKELFRLHSYWAHNSLYYLDKFILHFKDMTPHPHKRVCDFIQFWRPGCSRKLLFMSRKSFKTSCVSVGDPIFCLINNPNDTLMIIAQERGYAMKILGQIKRQMEENEELIAINGRDFKGSWGWKEYEIFVNGRTDWVSKEPSIATAGIDSVKAGPHPRKVILDDVETEDNTSTEEACEKLVDNFQKISPMVKPPEKGGQEEVIGTPYAFEGVYYYILENPAELRHFDVLIGQARKDSGILPKVSKSFIHLPEGPEGTLLMPNVLTEEYLDDEEAKDPPFFAGQYMLSLSSGEAAEFKRDWFRYYLEKELPEKLKTYVLLDPAISQKSTADYACIKVVSQDELNNAFIRKIIHARLEPDEVIEYFYKFFFDYHPYKMGIETNGMQYLFKWQFDKEAKFRGRLPIFELKHYGKLTKKARIRALIVPYKEGRIYHLAGNKEKTKVHSEQRILESQLLHWNPKKKMHDDAADTLAMFLELSTPRTKRKKRLCPHCGGDELIQLRSGGYQCSGCLHTIISGRQVIDSMTGY